MYNPNIGISSIVDVIEVTSRSNKRFFQQISLLRTFFFKLGFLAQPYFGNDPSRTNVPDRSNVVVATSKSAYVLESLKVLMAG